MRWSTLVIPVTLFYSLSLVYAIPYDADEKRQRLDKRQGISVSPSSSPVSDIAHSSSSEEARSSSSLPSPTLTQDTPNPPSISSTPTQGLPSSTPSPSSGPSSTNSDSSSSTSSSSSSSSSGSGSPTLSSSSSTITNDPAQGSTSYRRFTTTRDLPSGSSSTDGGVPTGSASGSSFLKNKAAMGSTFAIVGLVGAAIIVGATFFVLKKVRKQRDEEELDNYFEKFPPSNSNANNQHSGGNDYGLGPSATDLTAPATDQAYMSRDVHYGATGQYPNQYANYNGFEFPPERGSVVEYPASYAPGTAYAAAMSQPGQYHYEAQIEDPNMVPNHPFADPDNRRY